MRSVLLATSIALILFLSAPAMADTITLAKSVPFAEDSEVRDSVKDECKMQTRLPTVIKKASRRWADVKLTSEPLENVEGKVLVLEFTNVFALGGGAYSGSKSAIVEGELRENGEVIGSVKVRRRSMVGMMPGTCSIMKRIVNKIGEDIAGWLKAPTMDAKIGDLDE